MKNNYGFPEGTQVLTLDGWKCIKDVQIGDACVTYCDVRKELIQGKVKDVASYIDTEMLKVSHKYTSFICGKDQQWFGWKRLWAKKGQSRPNKDVIFSLLETTQEFSIVCSAEYLGNNDSDVSSDDAAFLGWLLSDGYYKWNKESYKTSSSFGKKRGVVGMIAQAQHKFYKEVEEVISKVNINYSMFEDTKGVKTSPVNKYYFKCDDFRNFMDRVVKERLPKSEINWARNILSYNKESILSYLYNFWLADGDTKNRDFVKGIFTITQNSGTVAESVLLAMFLQGKRVSSVNKDSEGKCKTLRMFRNSHMTMQEVKKELTGSETTYCLKTDNNSYIIRQGGHISITYASF